MFFFKQETAYEMRISDWSSDVCSSDLRTIASQAALSRFVVTELRPGTETSSDDEIVDYIRQSGQTSYHPIGTCKMGNDDLAVVDDRLRVRGIDRLRVVDASIMPTMPSSKDRTSTRLNSSH